MCIRDSTMGVVYKPLALTIPLPDATAARKISCGKPDKSVSDSRAMMAGHTRTIELTLCFLRSTSQQKKETIYNQVLAWFSTLKLHVVIHAGWRLRKCTLLPSAEYR